MRLVTTIRTDIVLRPIDKVFKGLQFGADTRSKLRERRSDQTRQRRLAFVNWRRAPVQDAAAAEFVNCLGDNVGVNCLLYARKVTCVNFAISVQVGLHNFQTFRP